MPAFVLSGLTWSEYLNKGIQSVFYIPATLLNKANLIAPHLECRIVKIVTFVFSFSARFMLKEFVLSGLKCTVVQFEVVVNEAQRLVDVKCV